MGILFENPVGERRIKVGTCFWGGRYMPLAINSSLTRSIVSIFSAVSLEARNLRDLCWFILALGIKLKCFHVKGTEHGKIKIDIF